LRAGTGAAKEAGMEEHAPKRKKWVVAALLILPVWLLASGGVGIWLHFKHQAEEDKKEVARYATMVSQESLADDLRKLTQTIGERNTRAADGNGLTRAAAWLEGTLGPSNTGYALKRARGPADERWPLLRATLRGSDPKAKPLWVVAAYDSPVGSPGSFTAPVRIAVVRESDQNPVVSKLFGVPVTVPPGRSEAPFTLVTDQIEIPYTHANAQHDYTIKVGFDTAGAPKASRAAPRSASTAAPSRRSSRSARRRAPSSRSTTCSTTCPRGGSSSSPTGPSRRRSRGWSPSWRWRIPRSASR